MPSGSKPRSACEPVKTLQEVQAADVTLRMHRTPYLRATLARHVCENRGGHLGVRAHTVAWVLRALPVPKYPGSSKVTNG